MPDLATLDHGYGDLLDDIDLDDLNDFEGLDDFDYNQVPNPTDENLARDPFLAILPVEKVPITGFATGRGKVIAPPSASALDRVRKLFEDADAEAATTGTLSQSGSEFNYDEEDTLAAQADQFKRRKVEHENVANTVGFTNGRGVAVPMPTDKALRRARQMFDEIETEPEEVASEANGSFPGIGHPVSHVDHTPKLARDGEHRFDQSRGDPGPTTMSHRRMSLVGELQPASLMHSGFAPDQDPIGTASKGSNAILAVNLSSETDSHQHAEHKPESTTHGQSLRHIPPKSTPFRAPRILKSSLTPQRPTPTKQVFTDQPIAQTPIRPFRTPLRQTTNTFSSHTPKSSLPLASKAMSNPCTPSALTPSRIGLSFPPGSRGRAKKTFITPFKDPSRLAAIPLRASFATFPVQSAAGTIETKNCMGVARPVFDLSSGTAVRKSMREAHLHPQYCSAAELKEMGLPDEIWNLDISNAPYYQFIAEDATTLGSTEALGIILRDGAALASQKWVNNHYALILWKMAGQVQAQPALFDEKWNWAEVISQLEYRYEREYGHAQRPIIRRIQEHDSAAGLPLVLCVAAVKYSVGIEGARADSRPYLELTDGWYKIVAEIDECLARAVKSGKIAAGRKLAISGAKLESGGDGADALDAFDKSRLLIYANSSAPARWHAKLGLQGRPFVAGLSSLSVDGGPIVLMDVVIEKLYPLAYMPGNKAVRESPWNQDEEQARADKWKDVYAAESTRLLEEMRKRLEKVEDLVSQLCAAAQDITEDIQDLSGNWERDFESLLATKDWTARLRSFSNAHIVHLARYAQNRMQQELNDGQAEVEAELETVCPQRDVREFRMARIRDAQEGRKEPVRTGMLNIWDANALGEGAIQEGKRYLVSNLIPGRQGNWSIPKQGGGAKEIYLHTRRDTRWKQVDPM